MPRNDHNSDQPTHSGPNRRQFLTEAVTAGVTLASAGAMLREEEAHAQSAAKPANAADAVPMVTVAGITIPRMIIGCNQIGGWSHGQPNLARATVDYFTPERTVSFYRDCELQG